MTQWMTLTIQAVGITIDNTQRYTEGGRDAPLFYALSSYELVSTTVVFVRVSDSYRCVLMLYRSRRY